MSDTERRWRFETGNVFEFFVNGFTTDDIGKRLYSDDSGNLSLSVGNVVGVITDVTSKGILVNIPDSATNYEVLPE